MNKNHLKAIFISIVAIFIFSSCASSEQNNAFTDIPSAEGAEQNGAFLAHAEANNWYITSGSSFVKFDENLDYYWLPKLGYGRATTLDLLYAKHLGHLNFSPDGKLLVAKGLPHREPSSKKLRFIIFDMDLNTVIDHEGSLNHHPNSAYRWSPDGKYISFTWESNIMLYDVAADSFTEIYNDHKTIENIMVPAGTPSWSSDNKQLVFQTNSDEIAILTIATGEVDIIGKGRAPSWSPDSRVIVYHQGDKLNNIIAQYSVATGETEPLFKINRGFNHPLIWTPDSQYLIFNKGFVNSIYGEMMVYSYADNEVQGTGKAVATLADSILLELPTQFENKLRLRDNYDEENPNRNPRLYGDQY